MFNSVEKDDILQFAAQALILRDNFLDLQHVSPVEKSEISDLFFYKILMEGYLLITLHLIDQ